MKHRMIEAVLRERERRGIGMKAFSSISGYDPRTLRDLENGKTPTMLVFIDIVNALGGTVIVKLGDEEIKA